MGGAYPLVSYHSLVRLIPSLAQSELTAIDTGVGAGIDSYYEYLLKAYVFLGDQVAATQSAVKTTMI